jgi:hypothetical protein
VALDLSALAYFAGSSNIRSQRMKSREAKTERRRDGRKRHQSLVSRGKKFQSNHIGLKEVK